MNGDGSSSVLTRSGGDDTPSPEDSRGACCCWWRRSRWNCLRRAHFLGLLVFDEYSMTETAFLPRHHNNFVVLKKKSRQRVGSSRSNQTSIDSDKHIQYRDGHSLHNIKEPVQHALCRLVAHDYSI